MHTLWTVEHNGGEAEPLSRRTTSGTPWTLSNNGTTSLQCDPIKQGRQWYVHKVNTLVYWANNQITEGNRQDSECTKERVIHSRGDDTHMALCLNGCHSFSSLYLDNTPRPQPTLMVTFQHVITTATYSTLLLLLPLHSSTKFSLWMRMRHNEVLLICRLRLQTCLLATIFSNYTVMSEWPNLYF